MRILALNSGSSSLKFRLLEGEEISEVRDQMSRASVAVSQRLPVRAIRLRNPLNDRPARGILRPVCGKQLRTLNRDKVSGAWSRRSQSPPRCCYSAPASSDLPAVGGVAGGASAAAKARRTIYSVIQGEPALYLVDIARRMEVVRVVEVPR